MLEREEQAGGVPRHCAHQGFGAARPASSAVGPPLRPALRAGGTRRRRHDRAPDDGHRLVAGRRAAAHRPGRAPIAGGPGGRARDRVPRAPAVGPPDRRVPPARGDEHRHAAAARAPARPAPAGQGADRGRRARELLGPADAAPGRCRGGRDRHRAAPPAVAAAGGAGGAGTVRRPGVDPHGGARDRGPRHGRAGPARAARHARDRRAGVRAGRVERRLDPRPRAGGARRARARPCDPRPPRGPRPALDAGRGVRGRQPGPGGGARRRRRARRTPRGAYGRELAQGPAGVARAGAPDRDPAATRLDLAEHARHRRRGTDAGALTAARRELPATAPG